MEKDEIGLRRKLDKPYFMTLSDLANVNWKYDN